MGLVPLALGVVWCGGLWAVAARPAADMARSTLAGRGHYYRVVSFLGRPGWLLVAHVDRLLATGTTANCDTRVRCMCDVRWGRGRRCKRDSTRRVEDGWQVGAMHTPVPSKRASADELSLHPARTTRNRLAIHKSDAAPRLQSIKVSTRSPSSIPTRLGLGSEAGPRRRRGGGERRGTSHQARKLPLLSEMRGVVTETTLRGLNNILRGLNNILRGLNNILNNILRCLLKQHLERVCSKAKRRIGKSHVTRQQCHIQLSIPVSTRRFNVEQSHKTAGYGSTLNSRIKQPFRGQRSGCLIWVFSTLPPGGGAI